MIFLLLIISTLVISITAGHFLKKKNIEIKKLGKIQTVLLFVLVFLMGAMIGSDDRLIESVKSIGVSALVVTVATMGGSILAIFILRKCLRLDRKGEKMHE